MKTAEKTLIDLEEEEKIDSSLGNVAKQQEQEEVVVLGGLKFRKIDFKRGRIKGVEVD